MWPASCWLHMGHLLSRLSLACRGDVHGREALGRLQTCAGHPPSYQHESKTNLSRRHTHPFPGKFLLQAACIKASAIHDAPTGGCNLLQDLANQCMHPDKDDRPTFEEISDVVEDLIVTIDQWSEQGLAPPSQTSSAKPSCLPEQHQLSAVLLHAQ